MNHSEPEAEIQWGFGNSTGIYPSGGLKVLKIKDKTGYSVKFSKRKKMSQTSGC